MDITQPNLSAKFLGILCCSVITIFTILIFPFTFMVRVTVIVLAKALRSDLGDILNEQSAVFIGDYVAKTPPRSNLVMPMIIQGHLTLEEVRAMVIKNWISDANFRNLQRYPVTWLGLPFWRNIPKPFTVEDYVHKYSGMEAQVTDQELNEFTETLLNSRLPKNKSPWELHLIENYKYTKECESPEQVELPHYCVLILKWHHCLIDGTGVTAAVVEGLFRQHWNRKEPTPTPKLSTAQMTLRKLTFPFKLFREFSYLLAHVFVEHPLKIPDKKKKWHQVYARSGLIPNQLIKGISHSCRVSYTSVLISAISAAIYKSQMQKSKSLLFMSVLPARGVNKREILSNQWAGTIFDLPTTSYKDPIERVKMIGQVFEKSRWSVKPYIVQYGAILSGTQFSLLSEHCFKNRTISVVLTNIAGVQANIKLNENAEWIQTRLGAGGVSGDTGIAIAAFSHGENTELHIAAESALMTREQAQAFIHDVKQEVETLAALILNNEVVPA